MSTATKSKPVATHEETVALILNEDGTVYDEAFNWESAQSYALNEGMRVKAVKRDGHMSRAAIQRLCDAELARHQDCWGSNN